MTRPNGYWVTVRGGRRMWVHDEPSGTHRTGSQVVRAKPEVLTGKDGVVLDAEMRRFEQEMLAGAEETLRELGLTEEGGK